MYYYTYKEWFEKFWIYVPILKYPGLHCVVMQPPVRVHRLSAMRMTSASISDIVVITSRYINLSLWLPSMYFTSNSCKTLWREESNDKWDLYVLFGIISVSSLKIYVLNIFQHCSKGSDELPFRCGKSEIAFYCHELNLPKSKINVLSFEKNKNRLYFQIR